MFGENLVGPPGIIYTSGIYTYCPKSEWKASKASDNIPKAGT